MKNSDGLKGYFIMDSSKNSNSQGKVQAWMRQHPLISFFAIAYAVSWILSIPFILSEWGVLQGDFRIVFVIKSFGPFLAAYIMLRITEGKEGVLRLNKSILQTKASLPIYLFTFLGIPTLIILGILIQPGTLENFKGLNPTLLISYPLTFIAVLFGGGPMGEEPGWRGYALPRLQRRFGPLWGTLILSLLWTCWHLPDFLTSAQGGGPGTGITAFLKNFPLFLVLVTALAIILTWVFNRSNGSVFIALLAHASVNTPQVALVPLFPAVDTTILNLAALIGLGTAALLIVIFTRGKLGYSLNKE